MRKFGLCLFYGLCVFTIAFSLFWMALPASLCRRPRRTKLRPFPAASVPSCRRQLPRRRATTCATPAAGWPCSRNADGTPGALQQLTGIYVNLLPENDVLRIRRGIRVHSLPELQALLEDLGG